MKQFVKNYKYLNLQMNAQLQMSQYNKLILYIEYANETSAILNGEEVFAYFYDKIVMDIYKERRFRMDTENAKIEIYTKRLLSWFAFFLFCRIVFYIVKFICGFSKSKQPIRVVVNR